MDRLHPLSGVYRSLYFAATALFLATTILPAALGAADVGASVPAPAVAGLAVLGLAYGFLSYRRFTYELTADTFDLGKGVIARTEREIPLRRIQNVDVQQGVLQQAFGLAVVRIETAGGGSTEATLAYVALAEAERLQRGIRDRRRALTGGDADGDAEASDGTANDARAAPSGTTTGSSVEESRSPPSAGTTNEPVEAVDATDDAVTGAGPDGEAERSEADEQATRADREGATPAADASGREPLRGGREPRGTSVPGGRARADEETERLVELKFTDLLVLAVTNFQIGSLLFLFFGAPLVGSLATDVLLAAAEPFGGPETLDTTRMTPDDYFVLGGVAGPLLAVAGYVMSALVAVQEYYDFELARRGNDLVYERGLLQKYSGSIPTDKIQTLTVTETAPMRWLGYAALGVETAGYAGGRQDGGSQAAVPLARRGRVRSLAHELFDYDEPELERPPKRARLRYGIRYGIVALAAVALAYGVAAVVPGFTLWYVPAAALLAVPPAAHLKWAHRGYALDDDHVVVRSGFWRRRTSVVPYYRIQTVVGEATVFQRRRDLTSVVADTASSATFSRSSPAANDLDDDDAEALQRELRERLQSHLRGGADA